jgi:integrase
MVGDSEAQTQTFADRPPGAGNAQAVSWISRSLRWRALVSAAITSDWSRSAVTNSMRSPTAATADPVALLGLRDRALLLTLYYEALRRSEAARLSRGDIRRDARILVLRDTKTTDRDELTLRPETAEAIDQYLAVLDDRLPGTPPGRRDPVFVSLSKRSFGRRLSPSAILEVVKKRAREAAIRRNIVAHSLRHAAVTHALDHHASLEETGAHARHRDPRTTVRYDRRRKRRGAAAADALPHLAV